MENDVKGARDTELTVAQALRILWKGKFLIAVITLACAAGAVLWSYTKEPEYDSTVTALVISSKPQGLSLLSSFNLGGAFSLSDSNNDTYATLLKTRRFAEIVAKKLKLGDRLPQKDGRKTDFKGQISFLMSNTQMPGRLPTPGILILKATANDPKLAADIANTYMRTLQEYLDEHAMSNSVRNRKYVEQKLEQTRARFDAAVERKRQFMKDSNLVIDPTSDVQAEVNVYTSLLSNLNETDVEVKALQVHRESLRGGDYKSKDSKSAVSDIYSDNVITNLRSKLVDLEMQLAQSDKVLKSDSNTISRINEHIADIKVQIKKEMASLKNSRTLDDDLKEIMLTARSEALNKLVKQYEERFDSIPGITEEFTKILADIAIQQGLLENYSKELETVKMAESREKVAVEIADPAFPADMKSRPRRKLILIAGFAAGFLISCALVFLLDSFKTARPASA